MRGSRLLVRTLSHEPAEGECSESEAGYTHAGGGVSRAAVDTLSDGVHAELARSAFEAVSAANLVPINNRAGPRHPLDGSFGFECARAP
jgi:hypothetical protein